MEWLKRIASGVRRGLSAAAKSHEIVEDQVSGIGEPGTSLYQLAALLLELVDDAGSSFLFRCHRLLQVCDTGFDDRQLGLGGLGAPCLCLGLWGCR